MTRWALLAALALATACGTARRGVPVAGPMAFQSEKVAFGERVFMQKCNQCHPRGEAGLAPAINNKPLPGFLIAFQVRHGLGAMPSFNEREVSDRELDAIIAYLKYLRSREPTRGLSERE